MSRIDIRETPDIALADGAGFVQYNGPSLASQQSRGRGLFMPPRS
jgi:hypothetical protein